MMMMMMMMMQSEQKINSLISNLWRKGEKKKRSSLASARISCAWRRGGDSWEVKQTLQRSAPGDERLPGAGQLDWNASDTDSGARKKKQTKKTKKENKATLLTICSVISTTGTKVPPCLPRAGGVRSVMVVQLCVCVCGGGGIWLLIVCWALLKWVSLSTEVCSSVEE